MRNIPHHQKHVRIVFLNFQSKHHTIELFPQTLSNFLYSTDYLRERFDPEFFKILRPESAPNPAFLKIFRSGFAPIRKNFKYLDPDLLRSGLFKKSKIRIRSGPVFFVILRSETAPIWTFLKIYDPNSLRSGDSKNFEIRIRSDPDFF